MPVSASFAASSAPSRRYEMFLRLEEWVMVVVGVVCDGVWWDMVCGVWWGVAAMVWLR